MGHRPKIVIIGGGFAGLQAARHISKQDVDVTLIDKRNYHLFQPLLYQVATGGLSPGDIAAPLRGILKSRHNVRIVLDEVIDFKPENQEVCGLKKNYHYDYLVVAVGVQYNYFGHQDWQTTAPSLKTVEDALLMRSRILNAFELAEMENDEQKRQALMTFAIIGAGPTGVELAGAISELARTTLTLNFRAIKPSDSKILLIEAGPRILNAYPEKLSQKAARSLEKLGAEIHINETVTAMDSESLTVKRGESLIKIPCKNVLWAAGVSSLPIAGKLAHRYGAACDKQGRLKVTPHLCIPNHDRVLVVGDMALVLDAAGQALPGIAPAAMQQGRYAARLIKDSLHNRSSEPFRYIDKGSLAVIGRNAAVADLGRLKVSGFPAWVLWVVIHIAYLVEFDNKLMVLFQWAWNYVTRKRGARMINLSGSIGSKSDLPSDG